MTQAVSPWPLTVDTEFAPGSVPVGYVVEKVALRQIFLRVLRYSLLSIISPCEISRSHGGEYEPSRL
jgi:hypothetical protein